MAGPNWLQEDDKIVLAVVDEPANSRRWWATVGGGTWEQTKTDGPRRLHVSERQAAVPTMSYFPPSVEERLPAYEAPRIRSPLPLVDVIHGDVDAFYVDLL